MKWWQLHQAETQVMKMRLSLGDLKSPIDQIKRPHGMQQARFDLKIARLRKREDRVRRILVAGIAKKMQK